MRAAIRVRSDGRFFSALELPLSDSPVDCATIAAGHEIQTSKIQPRITK
jgi:hypothetical protein